MFAAVLVEEFGDFGMTSSQIYRGVDKKGGSKFTPLDIAISDGNTEVADLLRKRGGKTATELWQKR